MHEVDSPLPLIIPAKTEVQVNTSSRYFKDILTITKGIGLIFSFYALHKEETLDFVLNFKHFKSRIL